MRKITVDRRLIGWYKIISDNIIMLRGKMSQEELARRAGITRETVGAIEAGKSVGLDTILKIAIALHAEPADLLMSKEKKDAFFANIDSYLDMKISEALHRYEQKKKLS